MPVEGDTYESDIEGGIDAAEDLMAQVLDLAREANNRPGFTSGLAAALCATAGILVARLDARCRANILRSMSNMLHDVTIAEAGRSTINSSDWIC